MNPSNAQRLVERELGRSLRTPEMDSLRLSQEWDDLISDRYGSDAPGLKVGVADCVAFLRERERLEVAEAGASADPSARSSAEVARIQALSLFRWSIATADQGVTSFRADVLGNELVAVGDVAQWVAARSAEEGRGQQVQLEDGRWVSPLKLFHPSLDGTVQTETGVLRGGELDRLRMLTERLVRDHRWQASQATSFVLTDAVPIVSPLRVTTSPGPGAARIVLDIDPDTPAEAVAAAYGEARRGLHGARRRPSELSLRLTSMWLSHDQPQYGWLARRWNAENSRKVDHRSANQAVSRTVAWLEMSAE